MAELMDPELLPRFADEFNRSGHQTAAGKPIVVTPVLVGSARQVDLLKARIGRGVALDQTVGDPTIVTPKIDHWLSQLNEELGQTAVDVQRAQPLAISWLGIATYREMAECLGWPNREIGFADIVALRADPRGWSMCPKAKVEWGMQPMLSFTDPSSSSTARSALFALYAIGADKPTDQLTPDDVADPTVQQYVRTFQSNVDHYVADTLILQSKMYQGPRYGHFYVVEENTLVELYQGKLPVTVGAESRPQPLTRDMVFLYPKEGSLAHNHPAAVVEAPWVTPDQAEAAQAWIAFLREDAQQQSIMSAGFRPATSLPLGDPISPRFGLNPAGPSRVFPSVSSSAVSAMLESWQDVKKPGVVTFVVDVSGSMSGAKLEQARKGLTRALDTISTRNEVGLVTFNGAIKDRIAVAPIASNRFAIGETVGRMQASGDTALYDALAEGIHMSDAAGPGAETIRGVVVLTDGRATMGRTRLDQVVHMSSRTERPIVRFDGLGGSSAVDEDGVGVDEREVVGTGLALRTQHPVHVFFIGLGQDADLEIGRILAEATGSAYQGVAEKDLAAVVENFGKYF
ncbi:MAG TPA: VWA domain-containing protein [Chloroflexota bacterium]